MFKEKGKALVQFMLSPDFLDKPFDFEGHLSEFQMSAMTSFVVIEEQMQSPGGPVGGVVSKTTELPVGLPDMGEAERRSGVAGFLTGFLSEKSFALVLIYIALAFVAVSSRTSVNTIDRTGALVSETRYAVPLTYIALIGVGFGLLLFLPDVLKLLYSILARRKEELSAEKMGLDDYIQAVLKKIREKYNSGRYLIMVQDQDAKSLPSYARLYHEEQFNRKEQLRKLLASEFAGQVNDIVNRVEKAGWQRVQFLVNATVQVGAGMSGMKAAVRP